MNTRLHEYFQALEAQDRFSGAVLITQGQTQLHAEAYGYANRAWKIKNKIDTRFDVASVTKLLTAVATLQLIERGTLSFDMSVIDYLGITDTTISKAVTPYHLLTHSSGIADDADEEAGELYEDLWKTKANYSVTNTADFLPQFIHKPPNFEPGQGCRYCNVSFILLGLMIEKATGMTYREVVQQNIFDKAGMTRSGFFRMDRVTEDLAEGADPIRDEADHIVGWKKNIYSYPPIGSPDGGAHLTVGDLNHFLRTVQAGKLLSAELTKGFLTPHVYHSEGETRILRCGYAMEFLYNKSDELMFYEKEGINVGVSAIIRHYPMHDLNVVMMSNLMDGVWKPVKQIHEWVMSGDLWR
jgi:CubicO group peptidase (beta-lactamase class C family)